MKISTLKHFFIDAMKSIKRNKSLTIASIATVAATLFIVGVFYLVLLNVNQGVNGIESKFEVKIYLKDDIAYAQKNELESDLKAIQGVKEVKYETKYEALNNFKEQLGEENKGILEGLDKSNPMPNSFIVKVENPDYITNIVEKIKYMPGVDEIQDGREIVNKITAITKTIKWAGVIIFIILVSVSLFLIGNTIKIAVFSRRREIGIMKYIGATDWFIRWPFILEGITIGLIGSIISGILLYYGYHLMFVKVSTSYLFMQLVTPVYILKNVIWEFIIGGVLIGATGSYIALRKFLAV